MGVLCCPGHYAFAYYDMPRGQKFPLANSEAIEIYLRQQDRLRRLEPKGSIVGARGKHIEEHDELQRPPSIGWDIRDSPFCDLD